MKRKNTFLAVGVVALLAIAGVFIASGKPRATPGVTMTVASAPDPGHPPLDLRIWYPDRLPPSGKRAMIVISHGTGGSAEGHVDTAVDLARTGFIVVSLNHTGDNYRDISAVGKGRHFIDRPRQITRVIDYMLTNWPHHASVDARRIGMFGHSAGGTTALIIAGAEPKLWLGAVYCRQNPQAWSCRYIKRQGLTLETIARQRRVEWVHDPRVKAAVIAAPAIGYSLDREALARVTIPFQLWAAERDDIVDDSPATIRAAMPTPPDYHLARNAGHFSFLAPCNRQMQVIIMVMTWFGTEQICADLHGFDRTTFHGAFNREIVAFFQRALAK